MAESKTLDEEYAKLKAKHDWYFKWILGISIGTLIIAALFGLMNPNWQQDIIPGIIISGLGSLIAVIFISEVIVRIFPTYDVVSFSDGLMSPIEKGFFNAYSAFQELEGKTDWGEVDKNKVLGYGKYVISAIDSISKLIGSDPSETNTVKYYSKYLNQESKEEISKWAIRIDTLNENGKKLVLPNLKAITANPESSDLTPAFFSKIFMDYYLTFFLLIDPSFRYDVSKLNSELHELKPVQDESGPPWYARLADGVNRFYSAHMIIRLIVDIIIVLVLSMVILTINEKYLSTITREQLPSYFSELFPSLKQLSEFLNFSSIITIVVAIYVGNKTVLAIINK